MVQTNLLDGTNLDETNYDIKRNYKIMQNLLQGSLSIHDQSYKQSYLYRVVCLKLVIIFYNAHSTKISFIGWTMQGLM